MNKCKSCGAEIIWIKMKSGRAMPCDPDPVHFSIDKEHHRGNVVLVTPDGMTGRFTEDPSSDKIGYISHFATCPNANQHRKRG